LKALYEYTINFALVECGGAKRYLDFQSIEDAPKVRIAIIVEMIDVDD
jgi:hypothetical protein